jgi:hypothetical protein
LEIFSFSAGKDSHIKEKQPSQVQAAIKPDLYSISQAQKLGQKAEYVIIN